MNTQPPPLHRQFQLHKRRHITVSENGTQLAFGPLRRDSAVDRVTDGVQHRGFTGAGGAVQQEYTGVVKPLKIDFFVVGVRHEGAEL